MLALITITKISWYYPMKTAAAQRKVFLINTFAIYTVIVIYHFKIFPTVIK